MGIIFNSVAIALIAIAFVIEQIRTYKKVSRLESHAGHVEEMLHMIMIEKIMNDFEEAHEEELEKMKNQGVKLF